MSLYKPARPALDGPLGSPFSPGALDDGFRLRAVGQSTASATATRDAKASASLSSSATATLQTNKSIPAQGALTASATASLAAFRTMPISASITGTATAVLEVLGEANASGNLQATSTATMAAFRNMPFVGSVSGTATASLSAGLSIPANASVSASATTSLAALRNAVASGSASGAGTATMDGTVSGGAVGLRSVSSISSFVEADVWAHLSESLTSGSVQTFAESGGNTGYDASLGETTGASTDDPSISGPGTAGGYLETDGGDFLLSLNSLPAAFADFLQSGNSGTFLIAWSNPASGTQNGRLFSASQNSGPTTIFVVFLDATPVIWVGNSITSGQVDLPAGVHNAGTDNLLVIAVDNGAIKYAYNARTFNSPSSFNLSTNSLGNFSLMARQNSSSHAITGTRLYGWGFTSHYMTDAQLADVVDYCRTNVSALSGLPAS